MEMAPSCLILCFIYVHIEADDSCDDMWKDSIIENIPVIIIKIFKQGDH